MQTLIRTAMNAEQECCERFQKTLLADQSINQQPVAFEADAFASFNQQNIGAFSRSVVPRPLLSSLTTKQK